MKVNIELDANTALYIRTGLIVQYRRLYSMSLENREVHKDYSTNAIALVALEDALEKCYKADDAGFCRYVKSKDADKEIRQMENYCYKKRMEDEV